MLITVQEQLLLLVKHTVPPPPEPTIMGLYPNDPINPAILEEEYCTECSNNLCRHKIPTQYDTQHMAPAEFLYQHMPLDIHTKLLRVELCVQCYTLGHLHADCLLQYNICSMTAEELQAEQEVFCKEQVKQENPNAMCAQV